MPSNPNLVVRVAANLTELKANLAEGKSQIETTTAAMQKLASSFSGDRLIQQAMNVAAAVNQIGGASKLTATEQERVNSVLERALEKYRLLGKEAPAGLQALATATKSTHNSWQDFVQGFDVRRAISDPLGTARSAMLALAESIGPVGIAAGVAATAIAAVGAAVAKLVTDAAAVGGQLDDMADKTLMSVPALSRLSNAAQVAGSDLNTLTNVVFMLEQRLGAGGTEVAKALDKMGLSIQTIKAAGPDKYLDLVVQGLARIADPTERAAAGTALLGRQYRDVAGTLADLNRAMELTADMDVWTAEQAQQAEEFQMQMKSLKLHAMELAIAFGRDALPYITAFISKLTLAVNVAKDLAILVSNNAVLEGFGDVGTPKLPSRPAVTMGGPGELNPPNPTTELGMQQIKHAIEQMTTARQAAAKASHDEAEALKKLASTYVSTLALERQMNRELVERLSITKEVTAEIMRQAGIRAENIKAALGPVTDPIQAAAETRDKQLANLADRQARMPGVDMTPEFQRIHAEFNATVDAIVMSGQKLPPALDDTAGRVEAGGVRLEAAFMAAAAKLHVETNQFGGKTVTDSLGRKGRVGPGGAITYDALTTGLGAFWKPSQIPGFAGGVQNFSGGTAIVGERGPEVIELPRGSNVLPGGGGGITIEPGAIVIQGSVLSSAEQLAHAIGDAVMRKMRAQGARFPTGA